MSQNKKRKLSAILFADIVNYSALMQHDEQQASQFLKKFRETLTAQTDQNGGEIVQFYGDGCLCVFASSVHAVRCAKALQLSFLSEPTVPVRVGVHSGDVFFEADNVYGDSVNIASRIESLGSPGAVLFSERVAKDLSNQPEFLVTLIGTAKVKNIAAPQKIFALANHGLEVPTLLSSPSGTTAQPQKRVFRKPIFTWSVAGLLLAACAAYFIFDHWQPNGTSKESTVAVLTFENNTGDSSYQIVSKMITDRIVHGITQNDLASVITDEILAEFEKTVIASPTASDPFTMMRNQFGVTEVIKGHVYIDQEDLVFECTISDAKSKKVVKGLDPVRSPKAEPMQGIEKVRQLVLGFLASHQDRSLDLLLETHVPKLEAYRALELAKASEDEEIELQYLNQAIELDSNYFEPKVLRLSWYYNDGKFATMDSLRAEIRSDPLQSDKRQQNLLNFYDALLAGKNNLVYQFMNREYAIAPFHLETNTTMIVLAMQFIYQFKDALQIYQEINDQYLDYANCSTCRVRLYLKAYLEMEMGRYGQALEAAQLLNKYVTNAMGTEVLIKSYAATKQWSELDRFIISREGMNSSASQEELYLDAAKACLQFGSDQHAADFMVKAKQKIDDETDPFTAAEIYMMQQDWATSAQFLKQLLRKDSAHLEALGYLAGLALRQGQSELGERYIGDLMQLKKPYQFGKIDYHLAQAYTLGLDTEQAISSLQNSVRQGHRFNFGHFHQDFIFSTIREQKAFQEVLKYWQ